MNNIAGFDIPFLLRQSAIVAGLAFAPLAISAGISRRRKWLLPFTLLCAASGWMVLFTLLYLEIHRINRGELPYQPFQVGPSVYALWDILKSLAIALWIPAGLAYGLLRYILVRRFRTLGRVAIVGCFIAYSIVGTTWTWLWLSVAEWSHEDTFAAPGFSWAGWTRVREGMSRADVESLLGPPISGNFKPPFAQDQGAECWVSNLSAGYFAAVWFKNGTVVRKQFWYSG